MFSFNQSQQFEVPKTETFFSSPSYDSLANNVYGGGNDFTSPMFDNSWGGTTYNNDFGGLTNNVGGFTWVGMTPQDINQMNFVNDTIANNISNFTNASDFINTSIPTYDAFDGTINNAVDLALAKADAPFWEYESPDGGLFGQSAQAEKEYWSNLAEQVAAETDADIISAESLASTVIDSDNTMKITETEVLDLSREAILGNPEKYGDTSAEQLSDSIMSDIDSGNFSSTDFETYLSDAGQSIDSVEGFDYENMTSAAKGDVGTLAQKLKTANDAGYAIKLVDDKYYDSVIDDPTAMTYGQYEELTFGDPFATVNGDFQVEPMNTVNAFESIDPLWGLTAPDGEKIYPTYSDYLMGNVDDTMAGELIKAFDNPLNPVQGTRLNRVQQTLSPQGTQWTGLDEYNPYDLTGFRRGDARESYTDFLRGLPVYDNNGYGLNPTIRKATNFLGDILDPIDDLVTGTGKLIGGGISKAGDVVSGIPLIGRPLGTSLRGLGGGIRDTAYGLGDFIDQGPQNLISSPALALQGLGQLAMGESDKGWNNLSRAGTDIIQLGKDFFSVPAGMAQTVVNTIRPLLPEDIRISISAGAGGGGGGGGGGRKKSSKSSEKQGTKVTRQTRTGQGGGNDSSQRVGFDRSGNPVTSGRVGSRTGAADVSGSNPASNYDLRTESGQRAYAKAYGSDAFDPNSPYFLPTILDGMNLPNLLGDSNNSRRMSFMDYVDSDIDYKNVGRDTNTQDSQSEQIAELSDQLESLKSMTNTSIPAAYRV